MAIPFQDYRLSEFIPQWQEQVPERYHKFLDALSIDTISAIVRALSDLFRIGIGVGHLRNIELRTDPAIASILWLSFSKITLGSLRLAEGRDKAASFKPVAT